MGLRRFSLVVMLAACGGSGGPHIDGSSDGATAQRPFDAGDAGDASALTSGDAGSDAGDEDAGTTPACAQNATSIVKKYVIEPGTATGGSTTTCEDSTQTWTTNQWVGYTFFAYAGSSHTFETSVVKSNTATTLTFGATGTAVVAGNAYGLSSAGNVAGTVSEFDQTTMGKYSLNFNDWGSQGCTMTQWINSQSCWGVRYSGVGYNNTQSGIGSYANVCRGWTNASATTSATGYTPSVGMGVQLWAMTKAKVHWSCSTPTEVSDKSRWDNLIDVYWWTVADPGTLSTAFPPHVDMQIVPRLMDSGGFAGQNATLHHYSTKTISGNTYNVVISSKGSPDWGTGFSDSTGYTVSLYLLPTTSATNGSGSQLWGKASATHDIRAIAQWLSSANPLDDSNMPVKNASNVVVSSANNNLPMSSTWYLGAVNAGTEFAWDTVSADPFVTNNFWVAMQNESDGTGP